MGLFVGALLGALSCRFANRRRCQPVPLSCRLANRGRVARPRADPDAISSYDMEVMGVESSDPTGERRNVKTYHIAREPEAVPLKMPSQMPEDAKVAELLSRLMEMSEIERADLIDQLTRKAFVLMEAGKVKYATKQLEQVSRIGAAFQHLMQEQDGPAKQHQQTDIEYLKLKSEPEILMKMRADLHPEDFVCVFGHKARWAQFMGAW